MNQEDSENNSDGEQFIYSINQIDQSVFCHMKIVDRTSSEQTSSYFKVYINGRQKFMHKQTAGWLFTEEKKHLLADRIRRVMQ